MWEAAAQLETLSLKAMGQSFEGVKCVDKFLFLFSTQKKI